MESHFQKALLFPLPADTLMLTSARTKVRGQVGISSSIIWCPSRAIMPTPNTDGCSDVFTTMRELLAWLSANTPSTAGTIWIGRDYNSAIAGDGNIVFDGLTLKKMARYTLTLKGGWNGPGKGTVNPNTPSTLDGASIRIFNWKGGIILRHLRVQNATTGAGAAVWVETQGAIQLEGVQVNWNTDLIGAHLDNSSSVTSPPGEVTVLNSEFSGNTHGGLNINTKGTATLKSVTASGNLQGYGIDIFKTFTHRASASSVTVTNGKFIENRYSGLAIYSNGMVTLTNVHAENNYEEGVIVDNKASFGDVILKGTNTFFGNKYTGLTINSNGSITAKHLVAYQNGVNSGYNGVYINNMNAPSAKVVMITDSGKFKGNGVNGLAISSSGTITANNLTATSNGGNGLWLKTSAPSHTQAVILTGVNADLNVHSGIAIFADGRITLTCSATYKNSAGLHVRNTDKTGPADELILQDFLSYMEPPAYISPVSRKASIT